MTAMSRAAFDARLAFRLQRFEVVGTAVVLVALVAVAIGFAGLLDATGYGAACDPMGTNPPSCEAMGRAFYDLQADWVTILRGLLIAAPFVAALLLGVPLIAREVERGTGRLAWSLAPSRLAWFVARLLPVLAVVAIAGLAAGLALDRLNGAVDPWTDPWRSFDGYGGRGVVFAARVVLGFAIAVALGAILGRTLPAVLMALVVGAAAIAGVGWVHERVLAGEAVVLADDGTGLRGAMYLDSRVRAPSGELLTWDQAFEIMPLKDETEAFPPPDWVAVNLVVPAARYPEVQAREVVALGLGTLACLAAAAVAVNRRRPG